MRQWEPPVQLYGVLPKDKTKLLAVLDEITGSVDEKELENYRKNLRHLQDEKNV